MMPAGTGASKEGHEAATQGRPRRAWTQDRYGHGVLGGRAERLHEGDALVVETKLERLAGAAVGHGKEYRRPVVHELSNATDKLGIRAGDLRLDHVDLCGGRLARPHDRREGQTLLGTEVQLARWGIETIGAHASRPAAAETSSIARWQSSKRARGSARTTSASLEMWSMGEAVVP